MHIHVYFQLGAVHKPLIAKSASKRLLVEVYNSVTTQRSNILKALVTELTLVRTLPSVL